MKVKYLVLCSVVLFSLLSYALTCSTSADCNDSYACTVDTCNTTLSMHLRYLIYLFILQGCVHANVTCDDNNACTVDSCSALPDTTDTFPSLPFTNWANMTGYNNGQVFFYCWKKVILLVGVDEPNANFDKFQWPNHFSD